MTSTIEWNGTNVIQESERKGRPRQLFSPWFAGNIGVLALSYATILFAYDLSFWTAAVVGVLGVVVSFLLCGFISLAGKRGSAPTLVLSRAPFGVLGNRLPAVLSWFLCLGWETVITALAVEATATVFGHIGWGAGTGVKVGAFVVVELLIVGGGVMGFDILMRLQSIITVVTGVLTVGFVALTLDKVHWAVAHQGGRGGVADMLGGGVVIMTAFGLGWVNAAADYSRYLPRNARSSGVVGWVTFGAAIGPAVLVVYGLFLAASDPALAKAMGANPIGALTMVLPSWFLFPFAVVAVLGLVGAAELDIYSSGLSLLTAGLRVPRYAAVAIDGTLMTGGAVYIVFFSANNFFTPFEGFLSTLGVPIAAWCGVMLADLALRRRPYVDADLFRPSGRYGSVQLGALFLLVLGTVLGWGLVTNTSASWLKWQGYLLGPFGLGGKSGSWSGSDLGVVVALGLGFVGWLVLGRRPVRRQERTPLAVVPVGAPEPTATVA